MVSPFFRRAMAPYCQWIGLTSESTLPALHGGTSALRNKGLSTLIQKFPESLIALGKNTDLGQVQADNPLVKTAFKLIFPIFIFPGRQEAPAAHAAEYIAFIILAHFLCGNIIRIKPFSDEHFTASFVI